MNDESWAGRLAAQKASLSRREEDLVDWITANPHDAAFLTLNDLCEAAGVSKPVVISCYRALGYVDYQAFLTGMQDFYAGQIDSYRASTVALKDITSMPSLLDACLSVELSALESLSKNIDPALLESMAREMLAAETVHVHGDGTGFYPGHYLVQRLRACGIRAVLSGTDREHVIDDLAPLRPGDVFLSFYYTQDLAVLENAMAFAAERGASVLLVAGFLEPRLCQLSRHHVFVPRGRLTFKNSMAIPMAFAHILLMAVEFIGGERLSSNLKKIEMHRRGIKATNEKEQS